MKKISLILFLFINQIHLFAQSFAYDLLLQPLQVNNLPGLQSFAFGKWNNKWLLVGGRLDGLHRRQPFASFDVAGHNTSLIVVDPDALQFWTAPLNTLPISMQEQLSSTNMQFIQNGEYLYCVGGYGFSNTQNDHITYPNLTAIKVPDVINAVINNTSFTNYFRQITDTNFKVTGGRLRKINNTYYLCGGQNFVGKYNPQGPNNGPGFFQKYTSSIYKFLINDNGININITSLPSHTDTVNLHRRDYNAESQIMPNGAQGITMFSGVFRTDADLPFLNAVNVDSTGYNVVNSFQQYYNHYHCAVAPLYDAASNTMHNLFFGGIAQYYDNNGVLTQDINVPFVKTIGRVSRNASGVMTEYKMPTEMPGLKGAGAEFIMIDNIPHYSNEVIKLNNLVADTNLIGYIYGGIYSTAPNIFTVNNGTQSSASAEIIKVFLIKKSASNIGNINYQSTSSLGMQLSPNPNIGYVKIYFNLNMSSDVQLIVSDMQGKIIHTEQYNEMTSGTQKITLENIFSRGNYLITIATSYEKSTQLLIVN